MTKRSAFKASDVTRALKATVAAGVSVKRLEIEPDGRIVLVTDDVGADKASRDTENEWHKDIP